ncbi:phosphate-binding protein, partial [Butyricicoccus sp. 1XD8-22]
MKKWKYLTMTAVVGSALMLGACGSNGESSEQTENPTTGTENTGSETTEQETAKLSGTATGDGSSTVAPIMDALVELYKGEQPDVQVSSGVSGTGGGFEKFIAGETDFS